MKLLIFGTLNHQHIQNFAKSLKRELGYSLIGVNNNSNIRAQFEAETSEIFDIHYNVTRLNNPLDVICKFISSIICFCKGCSNKVDIVQFHFVSFYVLPLLLIAKKKQIKTSVFVYGSDMLRSGGFYHKYCDLVFNVADSVVCDSTTLCEKLKSKYLDKNDKIECVLFGSVIIDKLAELNLPKESYKIELNLPLNRTIVMCGYNGSRAQNHLRIIDSLKSFSNNIYFVVPMTYSGSDEYINQVDSRLKELNFQYIILTSFIDDFTWCKYTKATDIFIHMQDTDAFSSSLAEHLFVNNGVINAEWLQYKDLSDNDIYYSSANFSNLNSVFENVKAQPRIYDNSDSIFRLKSLKYCIRNYWSKYFDRLYNGKI